MHFWWRALCVSLNAPDPPWSLSGCLTAPFCLQTKERIPVRALIQAARRQTPATPQLKEQMQPLLSMRTTRGLSHPWRPTEGDLSLGDWQPILHTARGHQVLKDLSVHRAAHRGLQLCAVRGVMKPPAGNSISLYVLGHGWVHETSREPFNAFLCKVFKAL